MVVELDSQSSVRPLHLQFESWGTSSQPPKSRDDFIRPVTTPTVKLHLAKMHQESPFSVLGL